MSLSVDGLYVYPIKGVRAVACSQSVVEERGLAGDRRWLIVDEQNKFVTQREVGALAQIDAVLRDGGLTLTAPDMSNLDVAAPDGGAREVVRVWKDDVNAADAGEAAGAWLSACLGRAARLFYMDAQAVRRTSGSWGECGPVSFSDGYPILITNLASLAALNDEIERAGRERPVGMARFRPNIVIDGAHSWAEDHWRRIQIGDVVLDLVKPCTRCIVTTKDQQTGEATGREPLRALTALRRSAHPDVKGVLFGWNAQVVRGGLIQKGDRMDILEERTEGWPLA